MSSHEFSPFTIKYPVEFYMDVYSKRFPTHHIFPFILDSEIVEQNEDKEKQVVTMKRKIKLAFEAPGWFKSLTGIQFSVFIEDSHFDLKTRKMTIVTVNETLNKKALLTDHSTYEPHPENPDWTVFKQLGKIEILMSTLGLGKKIEGFLLETYKKRYDESRKLDEQMIAWYLEQMEKDKKELQDSDEAVAEKNEEKEEEEMDAKGVIKEKKAAFRVEVEAVELSSEKSISVSSPIEVEV